MVIDIFDEVLCGLIMVIIGVCFLIVFIFGFGFGVWLSIIFIVVVNFFVMVVGFSFVFIVVEIVYLYFCLFEMFLVLIGKLVKVNGKKRSFVKFVERMNLYFFFNVVYFVFLFFFFGMESFLFFMIYEFFVFIFGKNGRFFGFVGFVVLIF